MIYLVLEILVYVFCSISFLMIILYAINLFITRKHFKNLDIEKYKEKTDRKVSFIVILPCLREQNVIANSIDYFKSLNSDNCEIYLLVACTKREELSNAKYGFKVTSAQVANEHIGKMNYKNVYVYEANDLDNGDRATQMNFAVDSFLNEHPEINIDIVAAFDADSKPTTNTFNEVSHKYLDNPNSSYQQPDVYLESANNIALEKKNPLVVSNAIYQNEWTMINEVPMLIRYGKKNGKYPGYFYCNGHGEFFPLNIWKKYRFPEYEITDGIHIGYRLGMSGAEVNILDNYGLTDAPHDLKALPKQHKRWYGGCNRLLSCYHWCKENGFKPKKTMVLAGFWSQFRWACTADLFLVNLVISIIVLILDNSFLPLVFLGSLLIIYCYIYSAISMALSPVKSKKTFIAYLLVPFAVLLKSFGPNIYWFNRLFHRKNIYTKVER